MKINSKRYGEGTGKKPKIPAELGPAENSGSNRGPDAPLARDLIYARRPQGKSTTLSPFGDLSANSLLAKGARSSCPIEAADSFLLSHVKPFPGDHEHGNSGDEGRFCNHHHSRYDYKKPF